MCYRNSPSRGGADESRCCSWNTLLSSDGYIVGVCVRLRVTMELKVTPNDYETIKPDLVLL